MAATRPNVPSGLDDLLQKPRLLTVADVCNLLQVAPTFVYRHAVELGAFKVGSHLRFRLEDLTAWLESQRLDHGSDCRTHMDNRLKVRYSNSRRKRG